MTRFVDRGAITAAWVGIGMAMVIAVSFLLVIPIEPVYWLLAVPAGLLIGYYANQRSGRFEGPWSRIIANALFAGLVTALSMALLLLMVKVLFFTLDDGYRDASAGGSLDCRQGAECVYARYLDEGRGPEFEANGITDVESFTAFYWNQQLQTALLVFAITAGSALLGGLAYGIVRPRPEPTPGQPRAG